MSVHTLLVTAFPAAFVAALTQVTNVNQVYTARKSRLATATVEVWIQPVVVPEVDVDGGGFAEPQMLWRYLCRVEKANGGDTDLEEFTREILRHFHGARRPNVAGLRHMRVENMTTDSSPTETPTVAILFDLVAVTREPISTG